MSYDDPCPHCLGLGCLQCLGEEMRTALSAEPYEPATRDPFRRVRHPKTRAFYDALQGRPRPVIDAYAQSAASLSRERQAESSMVCPHCYGGGYQGDQRCECNPEPRTEQEAAERDLRIFWGPEYCRLVYLKHLMATGRVVVDRPPEASAQD